MVKQYKLIEKYFLIFEKETLCNEYKILMVQRVQSSNVT